MTPVKREVRYACQEEAVSVRSAERAHVSATKESHSEEDGMQHNATRNRRLGGLLVALGVVLLGSLLVPASARAAPGGTGHTVSQTEVTHGTFDPEIDSPNPCSGAAIVSVDASGNTVFHITSFTGSDEYWVTGTETGSITLLDSDHVTYTGHLTTWFGSNWNRQNQNNSFTFSLKLVGSDGSTITAHEVQHFAMNANGDITVDRDVMTLTCG